MENKTLRYGLALIMGLALVSLTMQAAPEATQGAITSENVSAALGDIVEKIKAAIGENAEKAIEGAVQGLAPIVEKAVNQITEKTTQAATGTTQSFVDLASTKVFDGIDNLFGKGTFNITDDMIKSATGAFTDLKSTVGTIDSGAIAKALTGLAQIGTAAPTDLVKLSNVLIELKESADALEKIEQIKRSVEAVAKMMKDAIDQGVTLFDKGFDKAAYAVQAAGIVGTAMQGIIELRKQVGEQLSALPK